MSLPFAESSNALASTTYPDSVVTLGVSGLGGVGIQITGSFTGTLQFESSLDGMTFGTHSVTPPNSTTAVTSATAAGRWAAACATKVFRVRMSAFTAGPAAVVTLIGIPFGPSAGGSGGGGGGDASAANQLLEIADLDKLVAQILDGDTGGGTANTVGLATLLPANGGPVWGGTATNPIRVDPTGTTPQHAIIDSGTLTAVTTITNALPVGSNVIGHVITDTGSTTAVTGTVTVAGGLTDTQLRASAVPVTGTVTVGTHAVTIASGGVASGAIASGALASGSVASGAVASGAIAAGAIAAGATSIADNEDVASADGDRGVKMLAVRKATPANTSGTDGDYEFLQVSNGRLWTQTGGSVATNVAIADNPVNNGAQAVSSENAAVTTARQVQLVADLVGKLIVLPYANPENFVSGTITSAMTSTTSTSLVAAPAAGLRNYITQITVSNSHATQGTDVIIQDGSGGTTLYTIPAAALYGGATVTLPTPLRQPTTATALYCANVTTGASTKVSASGYKGV